LLTTRISDTTPNSVLTSTWLCMWPTIQHRGLHNFLTEGHISYYISVGGPGMLRNEIVSGYVASCQIKVFFVTAFFSLFTKCLRGPDEMASWAGLGPRVVVWRGDTSPVSPTKLRPCHSILRAGGCCALINGRFIENGNQ